MVNVLKAIHMVMQLCCLSYKAQQPTRSLPATHTLCGQHSFFLHVWAGNSNHCALRAHTTILLPCSKSLLRRGADSSSAARRILNSLQHPPSFMIFTNAKHRTRSWANSIQSTTRTLVFEHPLNYSPSFARFYLQISQPKCYMHISEESISPINATCPTHLVFPDFITTTVIA